MSYKFAVVEWQDAWLSSTLSADVNLIRTTAGWLVQNNKRVVRVALTVDERGPGDVMSIPRGMVRKVRVVDAKLLRDEAEGDEAEPTEAVLLDAKEGY